MQNNNYTACFCEILYLFTFHTIINKIKSRDATEEQIIGVDLTINLLPQIAVVWWIL